MARPRKPAPERVPTVPVYLGYGGKWHARIKVGLRPDGTPDTRHCEGPDEDSVKAKVFRLEDAMAKEDVPKPGRPMTVEAFFTHYLDVIAPVSGKDGDPLDPNTINGYRSMFRVWVFPRYGRFELPAFEATHLDEIYADMKRGREGGKPLMPTSLARNHSIIRRALQVALQRGIVKTNVAAARDNPGSTTPRKRRPASIAQARRVVEVIETRPNRLRWKIGLAIGPRQGEVLGLRWPFVLYADDAVDIAWQIQYRPWAHGCKDKVACARQFCRTGPCTYGPRWVHGCADEAVCKGKPAYCPRRREAAPCFRHQRECPAPCPAGCTDHAVKCSSRRGGGLVFTRPKTARGEELYEDGDEDVDDLVHPVKLPTPLMDELRVHEKEQEQQRQLAGDLWEEHGLVFCQENGKPIWPGKDREDWKSILREAGLKESGTHLMRHIAATMLIDLGVPIEIIQQVLGHTDIRTTRKYIRLSLEATKRAADAVGVALFGQKPASDNTDGSGRASDERSRWQRKRRRKV